MYKSTKRYGHEIGLSCCFRQHRADSHCRLLHGYALSFKFTFCTEDDDLDVRNWVVDFGGLKSLKAMLEDTFDHTLLVADDDPKREALLELGKLGLARVVCVPATGCEAAARMVFSCTKQWLRDAGYAGRVWLESVEVAEHGANSAIYQNNDPHPYR